MAFVEWPGEIDLAPDAMYEEVKKNGVWGIRIILAGRNIDWMHFPGDYIEKVTTNAVKGA